MNPIFGMDGLYLPRRASKATLHKIRYFSRIQMPNYVYVIQVSGVPSTPSQKF